MQRRETGSPRPRAGGFAFEGEVQAGHGERGSRERTAKQGTGVNDPGYSQHSKTFRLDRGKDPIQCGAGAQRGGGLRVVGLIVAADVDRLALDGEELGYDLLFGGRKLLGNRRENLLQVGVGRLRGERLRPVKAEVEMRAAVVDGPELATGRLVVLEEFAVGGVEGVGEDLGLRMLRHDAQMLEAGRKREELAERVPAQVVLSEELLDVLRRRTAGAGFEETSAVHERNDRKHFGAGADFENREEVREVVAKHVARDGDGVLAGLEALEGEFAGFRRSEHADVQTLGVMLREVNLHLRENLRVVGALLIEPENGRGIRETRTVDRELYPILHRGV